MSLKVIVTEITRYCTLSGDQQTHDLTINDPKIFLLRILSKISVYDREGDNSRDTFENKEIIFY